MRGADVLVRTLESAHLDTIFALSGNQIMPVFDACLDSNIRLIHTRHEAACAYMAEAYSQISGKPGVALVTAGAGLANAISPLLTAKASQTPLVLISGDSPVSADTRGAFQEMSQTSLTESVTKSSVRVMEASRLSDEIRKALDLAVDGQSGPVHVALPSDVLLAKCDTGSCGTDLSEEYAPLDEINSELRSANRPLIVLGPSLTPTRAGLLFDRLGIPTVSMESPRGANDPSLGRFKAAWQEVDLLIAIGKPIDFTLDFGSEKLFPHARWITVHGDPVEVSRAERNLGDRLICALLEQPNQFAARFLESTSPVSGLHDWTAQITNLVQARTPLHSSSAMNSQTLARSVNSFVARLEDPIIVCDGGEIGQWFQAEVSAKRRVINGVSGAIGGGVCYAIGAKVAAPHSNVLALMGDGSAGFHFMEFETAVRENIPFVTVIGNDSKWNAEHQLQIRQFGPERTHSCMLSDVRYDLIAGSLGGFGAHVTKLEDIEDALSEAISSGRPACVNVEIEGLPAPSL